jgi:hypothetical protein
VTSVARLRTPASEEWVTSRAQWLTHLFQDGLSGRSVLGYSEDPCAFGRSFLRAGAERVVAVTVASRNAPDPAETSRNLDVAGLEVVTSESLHDGLSFRPDVVWLHDVLPRSADPGRILDLVRALAPGGDVLFHLAHHEAQSLRQLVIETARRLLSGSLEEAFQRISPTLTREARRRSRGDLVASCVAWRSADELEALLASRGLVVYRQDQSFERFLGMAESGEFQPHHWLCGSDAARRVRPTNPPNPWRSEIAELERLTRALEACLPSPESRRAHAIGLLNTHFGALGAGGLEAALWEVFLFVTEHLLDLEDAGRLCPAGDSTQAWLDLFRAALRGEASGTAPGLPDDLFFVQPLLAGPAGL